MDLRAAGSLPPFWLLHPVGGNVLFAHRLLRHLPVEQPLIGIQARGLDGRRAPFCSIPEAAKYYLRVIRERQPEGPYFLGGPSFGGNLAYEIGLDLIRTGERVGMLALFDAFGPNYPHRKPWGQRLLGRLRRWGRVAVVGAPERTHLSVYQDAGIPEGAAAGLVTLRRVTQAHDHALRTYHPSPYPGRLHLFRAATSPDWPGMVFDDPASGWAALATGGLTLATVPGSHQQLLDPPWIDGLGVEFARALARSMAVALGAPLSSESSKLSGRS